MVTYLPIPLANEEKFADDSRNVDVIDGYLPSQYTCVLYNSIKVSPERMRK